ncbi:MAG: mechanosensitive ion channel [Woeseiaceae bacterium]|nr:mechanosensitive ion channel [Woeseiaceae bacterium]
MRPVILFTMLLFIGTAAGQEPAPEAPQPLPPEVAADFEAQLATIEQQRAAIDDLETRLEGFDEAFAAVLIDVFESRMDTVWAAMFDNSLKLARDVAAQRDAGYDVAGIVATLASDLAEFPSRAIAAMDRIGEKAVFATEDKAPAELVLLDQQLLAAVQRSDAILQSLVTYTQIAESMQIDASEQVEFLLERLPDSAANRSAYLQLSIDRVGVARNAVSTLPKDPDLPQRLLAAEARVVIASETLQDIVRLMNAMDLDTSTYRAQILRATGELTTDVLDVGVVRGLLADWSASVYDAARTQGPKFALRVLIFVLIVFVSIRLGRLAKRLATRALTSSRVRMSHLLKRMIVSTISNIVLFLGLLIGLSQLGISLGPLLAGLGIVGFIIGFALQDSLSNFASGLMILLYRPFDVGDFVEAGGVSGRVDAMSLVNTTFKTLDNQVLVVPNNKIWQDVIVNLTAQRTRRVDLMFSIAYGDDIDKAKQILADVAREYPAILDDPPPNIRVHELGESSVNLILRPWVKTDDYWNTYWDLTELVKKRFDEEGITIPFPQRTVHMRAPGS